jgi:3-oxoacyl-[acyl-carrier-protein] synthase II
MRMIRNNEADIMLAGGAEGAICELGVGGFCAMRALSTRNDEPKSASRVRSTRIATVSSSAKARACWCWRNSSTPRRAGRASTVNCPATGAPATLTTSRLRTSRGAGAGRAITLALADAHINADEDQLCESACDQHPAGRPLRDHGHQAGLGRGAARKKLTISATKSMIGHLLGAAGSVESAAVALMFASGALCIPPSI